MDLLRLDPHHPLRLIRHRRTSALPTVEIGFPIFLLPIPPGSLGQSLLIAQRGSSFSRRESEHLTHAHEDGYGPRFEDLTDAGAVADLGCGAAQFVEDGFEDGETGVDDAEEGFEGGEHGDNGVGFLRVGGADGGGVVDAVESKSADANPHQ